MAANPAAPRRNVTMTGIKAPVVFIHGLWLHASPDAVNTGNSDRGPLLLTMGSQDHTVPEAITKSTVKQYRHSATVTDVREFDRGHSLTIDSGWRDVADACLAWLNKYEL
jgi:predicted esterase